MATRRMEGNDAIEVYVSESNEVVIRSDYDTGGPVAMLIAVQPERVNELIRMLRECRDEALAARSK